MTVFFVYAVHRHLLDRLTGRKLFQDQLYR